MRKILWGLLLTFLIAMPVYGYTVVKGDTPYELWGANWKTELAKYGISDPRKLPVGLEVELNEGMLGATPTPTSSANRKYVESPDFYLYSPAVASDTTITLNTLKDIYGNILTMTDLGTLGYGRIDPDSATISESITFSGITANSDGTYTLTGVKSTLAKYPYTQTSGLKRSHSINAIFRLTNTAAFYDGFANKDNNEIVDGWWTFTSPTTSIFYAFPTVSSSAYTGLPTDNGQLATKYYVDTVGAGGFTSANVSTSYGVQVFGTSPETLGINASSTTGMSFDSNGALYQSIGNALEYTGNAIAVSTSTIVSQIATSTPTAGMIPMASSTGKINENWIDTSNIYSGFIAGEAINNGDAVSIVSSADTVSSTLSQTQTNTTENPGANTNWKGQIVLLPGGFKSLKQVVWGSDFSSSRDYVLRIRGVNGEIPTGADIASTTATVSSGNLTFTFSSPVVLTPLTKYAFIVTVNTTNASYLMQSTDVYADGSRVLSSDSGSTWATTTGDYYFSLLYYNASGFLFKSNSTFNDALANKFVGFSSGNYSYGQPARVRVNSVVEGFSNLIVGENYYLSNTSGIVSSTAGTISRKIGLSVSSTAILIKHDNP